MAKEYSGMLNDYAPHEINKRVHDLVHNLGESISQKEPRSTSIEFILPADSHIIPLFGKAMFEWLATFHNRHPIQNRFVSVNTLMGFDPEFGHTAFTLDNDTYTFGEDAITHELKHYLEMQSFLKNPHTPIHMGFSFFWEKTGDNYLLLYSGGIEDNPSLTVDQKRSVYLAPSHPSHTDLGHFIETFPTEKQDLIARLLPPHVSKVQNQIAHQWITHNAKRINTSNYLFSRPQPTR